MRGGRRRGEKEGFVNFFGKFPYFIWKIEAGMERAPPPPSTGLALEFTLRSPYHHPETRAPGPQTAGESRPQRPHFTAQGRPGRLQSPRTDELGHYPFVCHSRIGEV